MNPKPIRMGGTPQTQKETQKTKTKYLGSETQSREKGGDGIPKGVERELQRTIETTPRSAATSLRQYLALHLIFKRRRRQRANTDTMTKVPSRKFNNALQQEGEALPRLSSLVTDFPPTNSPIKFPVEDGQLVPLQVQHKVGKEVGVRNP